MSRILIGPTNAPFVPSGYGQQVAQLAPRLASLGHNVAIAAFCGLSGTRIEWNGIRVYPGGMNTCGNDVLAGHAKDWKADLVLTLMDAWGLQPEVIRTLPVAHWMPVDCTRLSVRDAHILREGRGTPVAMSQFGRQELGRAGFTPLYVPHGIDTKVFAPADKGAARDRLGIPRDVFVAGINASNADRDRKAWPEQLAAFAVFHASHPDSLLLAHTSPAGPGLDLTALVQVLGIQDAVRWSDSHKYATGAYTPADMALWCNACDAGLQATRAEGFGLPLIEFQACGVPVITTDASAMTELCGAGWLVDGEPYWNDGHLAWWCTPHVGGITAALEQAYAGGAALAGKARAFALAYDADALLPQWETVLGEIMAGWE